MTLASCNRPSTQKNINTDISAENLEKFRKNTRFMVLLKIPAKQSLQRHKANCFKHVQHVDYKTTHSRTKVLG